MSGFATPFAFLLLPLPLLAMLLLPPAKAKVGALVVPSGIADRLGAGTALAARSDRLHRVLIAIAWIALVIALAGPQRILPASALPATAREIVLVLDLSGSMERKDFTLDGQTVRRIDAMKAVIRAFLLRRAGDRVGLVLFAEKAEVAAVPTFDVAAVATALTDATIGVLGRSTAIGDGLGLAVKRLRESDAPAKVVVLMSDGTSTAGAVRPEAAAELARSFGIVVHTIALGTDEALPGSDGVASLVDTEALDAIAKASGGQSFRVTTTEELDSVTRAIDALEPSLADAPPTSVAAPLWPIPATMALLALIGAFVVERRRP